MKPTRPTDPQFKDFRDLVALAKSRGFHVTSTNGGPHNNGSAHYRGLAIDIRTRGKTEGQIQAFRDFCHVVGVWFYDERKRPVGQAVWTGPHIHLEIIPAKK